MRGLNHAKKHHSILLNKQKKQSLKNSTIKLFARCASILNNEVGCKERKNGDGCKAEPRSSRQAWCGVAQVCATARPVNGVEGCVGAAGQCNVLDLIAVSLFKTTLHFEFEITCKGRNTQ